MKPRWSQDEYERAFWVAARAHHAAGQRYPSTQLPYLCHVALVAQEVMAALAAERHADADLALQCACLHDCLEDTRVTYAQLLSSFGPAVADGVQALSKDEAAAAGAPDQAQGKARMMDDSLGRIRQQPRAVWLVKLADRITNLQQPPHFRSRQKRERYQEEARRILAALGESGPFLAARLDERIRAYEGWF